MDELGDSLLRLYRAGKLTNHAIKHSMRSASMALDDQMEVDEARDILVRLKHISEMPDGQRFMRHYWQMICQAKHCDWQEGGSGI